LVLDCGNLGKALVNSLSDYHAYCHLHGRVLKEFGHRQIFSPIHTLHNMAISGQLQIVYFLI